MRWLLSLIIILFLVPIPQESLAQSAGQLYEQGAAAYNQGKHEEAERLFRRVVEIQPSNYGAYNNLGIALYDQGKLDEAIANYQKALQLDPNFAYAYNNLRVVEQLGAWGYEL